MSLTFKHQIKTFYSNIFPKEKYSHPNLYCDFYIEIPIFLTYLLYRKTISYTTGARRKTNDTITGDYHFSCKKLAKICSVACQVTFQVNRNCLVLPNKSLSEVDKSFSRLTVIDMKE